MPGVDELARGLGFKLAAEGAIQIHRPRPSSASKPQSPRAALTLAISKQVLKTRRHHLHHFCYLGKLSYYVPRNSARRLLCLRLIQ
jgi:hypothetical protein